MTDAGPGGRRTGVLRRAALNVAAVLLPVILLHGCSAGTRHRLLVVFFDGVPDPAATARAGAGAAQPGAPEPVASYSRHAPVAKKLCNECHVQGTNTLLAPVPELCLRCHKFELAKKKYIHAPVVSGFCKLCHDPHSSRNPFLLVIKPEELCFYCHNPEDVFKNTAHRDRDAPCLRCHNPHVDSRFFLKEGLAAAPAAPAEEPAPTPTATAVRAVAAATTPAAGPAQLTTAAVPVEVAPKPATVHPQTPSPVSGVLRALLEQPEAQQQGEAWKWLFRLWGIRVGDGENGCAQALVNGLDCMRGEGGLEQLRRLDRPAIVRVFDPLGAPRWLVLEKLQGRQVTLTAGGARTVVDIGKLAGYNIKEFVLLWRPPLHTRGGLAAGDRGSGVAWLMKQLVPGGEANAAATAEPVFDEAVINAVRRFQHAAGIAADGVAGPETLILLDRDPAPGTPTLKGAG